MAQTLIVLFFILFISIVQNRLVRCQWTKLDFVGLFI